MVTLFIGNVSGSVGEADVRYLLDRARLPIASLDLPVDQETGDPKGYALVDLRLQASENPEVAADFAIHRLRGAELGGRPVNVEIKEVAETRGDGEMVGAGGGQLQQPGAPFGKGAGYGGPGMAGMIPGKSGMKGMGPMGPTGPMIVPPVVKGGVVPPPKQVAPPGKGRLKTQICNYWKENRCSRGASCAFAHGDAELLPEARQVRLQEIASAAMRVAQAQPKVDKFVTNRKTQICMYWKEGRCTRGGTCSFAHGPDDLTNEQRMQNVTEQVRQKLETKMPVPPTIPRSPRRVKPVTFLKKDALAAVEKTACRVVEPSFLPARAEDVEGEDDARGREADVVDADGDGNHNSTDPAAASSLKNKKLEPAAFLLSDEGMQVLMATYGRGAALLKAMGWCAGKGVGSKLEGIMEPVSVHLLKRPSTHYGRKDRRCLGVKPPKKFRDSDEASRSGSSPASSSSGRSRSRSSRKSSASSSRRRKSRSKSKRPRRKRKKNRSKSRSRSCSKSSASRSRSRSSSSSSSSSASRGRRRRRAKSRRKRGFSSTAGGAAQPKAAAGAAASGPAAATAAGVAVVAPSKVAEPPEIAMAKKQVLAKLTVLKNVEPKEQRAKDFRLLLREWHPDKNPERPEMATAVFQFLQKGKSLLNLK